jgi:hypothetical protein
MSDYILLDLALAFLWEDTAYSDLNVRETCHHLIYSVRHVNVNHIMIIFILCHIVCTQTEDNFCGVYFANIASLFSTVVPDIESLHLFRIVTWTLRQFDAPVMTVFILCQYL